MHVCVSYRLICQCVIRVGCYENYTRNTQTALVCTLLPVSYMLRCACWTSVCTKLCRRGQDVEHHRRARCDGSSAPCSGGPQISPHSCAAGAEGPLILAGQNRDFPRGKVAPWREGHRRAAPPPPRRPARTAPDSEVRDEERGSRQRVN